MRYSSFSLTRLGCWGSRQDFPALRNTERSAPLKRAGHRNLQRFAVKPLDSQAMNELHKLVSRKPTADPVLPRTRGLNLIKGEFCRAPISRVVAAYFGQQGDHLLRKISELMPVWCSVHLRSSRGLTNRVLHSLFLLFLVKIAWLSKIETGFL